MNMKHIVIASLLVTAACGDASNTGTNINRTDTSNQSGTCKNECHQASPDMCNADGDVVSCEDTNGDGCNEWVVSQACNGACVQGQCVECVLDTDCPNAPRNECSANHCVANNNWQETTLTIAGTNVGVFSNPNYLAFISPLSSASDNQGVFSVYDGYAAMFSVYLDNIGVGTHTFGTNPNLIVTLGSDARIANELRGSYTITSGSITLTKSNLNYGGQIAGTLTATIKSPNGVSGTLKSTFLITFP